MEVDLKGEIGAGDVLALVAIVVSLIALVRPWWQERRATLEVRNEHVKTANTQVTALGTERIVVKNHGPAAARTVDVAVWYEDPTKTFRAQGWNQPRSLVLYPGEELQLNYATALGHDVPHRVVVSWRDSRWRRQNQEFYPAVREIFLI